MTNRHRSHKAENFVVFGLVTFFLLLGIGFTSLYDHHMMKPMKPEVIVHNVPGPIQYVNVPGPTKYVDVVVQEPLPYWITDHKGSGGVKGHWCKHHRHEDPKCYRPRG